MLRALRRRRTEPVPSPAHLAYCPELVDAVDAYRRDADRTDPAVSEAITRMIRAANLAEYRSTLPEAGAVRAVLEAADPTGWARIATAVTLLESTRRRH